MISFFAAIAASLAFSTAPPDSNQITNPGFESGASNWSFWARATDSGSATLASSSCRTGADCLDILHRSSQDWAESNSTGTVAVQPGEVWQWTLWVRVDSLPGSAELGFVTRDSAGNAIDWNASPTPLPSDTGWKLRTARISVPSGCKTLQARFTGYGHGHLRIDDADFHRLSAAHSVSTALRVANDSASLGVDPMDLSMVLRDSIGGDSVVFAGQTGLGLDSAASSGDGLRLFLRQLSNLLPLELDISAHGGGVLLTLRADSSMPLLSDLPFPGVPATRAGQYLAMPRGTGLAIPVDGSLPASWSFRSSEYWEWQVSQAIAGATDGKTGFVVSVDQPWDARQYIDSYGKASLSTQIYQVPSKGVWGHDRSLLIAPLRSGGWGEMARRHRSRLAELGRVRNWTQKVAANPSVDRLRGAVDFWIEGSWSHIPAFFDTLRLMGLDKAVVNWTGGTKAEIDTLVSHGWLSSTYDDWADAFPPPGQLSGEYPSGAIVNADGSRMNGWLSHDPGGDVQALEICPSRHPVLARQLVTQERQTVHRNARFVDVELAMGEAECFSPDHPQDRAHDAASRIAALSIVKDTFQLVTGSEQHRDFATSVVDWGEGSMSIASVADAGYDWSTPEAPEASMDSLSMTAAIRVPLLPLATHDAFAPSWYTGDGQSKVPLRWDDKDAWNALYATMPLIMPVGRRMMDSLRVRYLRSANLLGDLHARCGFAAMTDFITLSADRLVQRTAFSNGWTVSANFDAVSRTDAGFALPAKGFLATGDGERIERSVLDGAVRSRARLSDRWFLDPEGSLATLDGVRTDGATYLRKDSDTSLLLSFVGDQDHMDILPGSLPWPSATLRASVWGSSTVVSLSDAGSGWLRLSKTGTNRFYRLSGTFGGFTGLKTANRVRSGLHVVRSGSGWECRWTQDAAGPVHLEMFQADGRILYSRNLAAPAGANSLSIPRSGGKAWIRLRGVAGNETAVVPMVR